MLVDSQVQEQKQGIKVCSIDDPDYPPLLKEIHGAPEKLWYRGTWPKQPWHGIGVVGSRKMSVYGKNILPPLVHDMARSGLVVVSGLAYGVDALAHESTLEVGGTTIAVVGGGVDDESMYPADHLGLAHRIIENGGVVVSESPPGMHPAKYSFPLRNRIIAGMSLGVLVAQGLARSGSLITAQCALEQNREVFALPGPLTDPLSEGPHMLIKKGAKLVTCLQDIFDTFEFLSLPKEYARPESNPENEVEASILAVMSSDPVHIDTLIQICKRESHIVSSALLMLEMRGVVRNVGSMYYVKI
ncbi:MAG: DNA-processing protein DprA [bacterium]|nr:DNA-processing protein DprA [bacterium]